MKNMLRSLFCIMTLCAAASEAYAGMPVTLRTETEVNRAAIRLGDVFDGVPSDIDRDIAIAPAPGKVVTYDLRVLTQLASQYRLDWKPQSTMDHTTLTRASTQITAEMIQKEVIRKVRASLKSNKDEVEIVFDNRNLSVDLPADRSADFSLVNFTYDEPGHRFRSDLVAQTNSQPVTKPVSGRVILKKNMPVLSRRLAAGTTIGASDLSWVSLNDEQINVDMIADADTIIGQEMRHDQAAGEVIRTRDIIAPRLVTRGSLVTIKVETPLMLIMAQGRAMQDGAKGEVVRVTNLQSNRVIEGTVEASGVIRVNTFRKVASAE